MLQLFIPFALALNIQAAADTLTVAMTGDIMMGTTYPTNRLPANDGRDLFKDTAPILQDATLAVGNLEGALCNGGTSTKGTGPYAFAFRTPTSYTHLLREAGYDFLSMANNHSNDFGDFGIVSTEGALDAEGLAYAGLTGRKEWTVVERGGVRWGLCAFGHNQKTLKHADLGKVKAILDTLKKHSDLIVVSFHGGAEGSDKGHLPRGKETYIGEARGDLRNFAHFCIDNGAALVFGHGPHVTRCVEVYKGHFIAYSLGNFCTPYGMALAGTLGYAPVITARILSTTGEFVDGQIHPFIQRSGTGPRKDEAGIVCRHIKSLTDSDVPESEARVLEDGKISKKCLSLQVVE